jgi:hypothetical protein
VKGFDDHLDNYGNPDADDELTDTDDTLSDALSDDDEAHDTAMWAKQWNPALYQKILDDQDDGITTDDFDNWPKERQFPS